MRPGCDRPAAARLTYSTAEAAVWLDRPLEDGQPAQQVCSIHAATLTAPLGWTVTDRRLVGVGPVDAPLQPPIVEEEVSPFTEAPAAVVEPTHTGVEEAVEPAESASRMTPKADTKSKGKLLERAFEWTGPQHSVLTTGHDHRPRRQD
jgi:hypothetical protein